MTAPDGGFDESAPDDGANRPPPGGPAAPEPTQQAPWEPLWSDHPPPAYPPPGPSAGYPPTGPSVGQRAGHPEPYPPLGPPGFQPPPWPPQPPPWPSHPPGPPVAGPPPGYGPEPYPGGHHPMPDYPVDYPDDYGRPWAMRTGTSGLAIASLISSLTGFLCCLIGPIVGILLGVVALSEIKQTRRGGYGIAVAGIVIGIGTLLVTLVLALFRIHPG